MSDKNSKVIRGQMRIVAKELLTAELAAAIQTQLAKAVHTRLDQIDAYIKEQLKIINDRSEETQSYVVRNLSLANVKAASNVDTDSNTPAS